MDLFGKKHGAEALKSGMLDKMEDGETLDLQHLLILRIPQGWIYYTYFGNAINSAVFVPEPESDKNKTV